VKIAKQNFSYRGTIATIDERLKKSDGKGRKDEYAEYKFR
jgi:hypothetical protein